MHSCSYLKSLGALSLKTYLFIKGKTLCSQNPILGSLYYLLTPNVQNSMYIFTPAHWFQVIQHFVIWVGSFKSSFWENALIDFYSNNNGFWFHLDLNCLFIFSVIWILQMSATDHNFYLLLFLIANTDWYYVITCLKTSRQYRMPIMKLDLLTLCRWFRQ